MPKSWFSPGRHKRPNWLISASILALCISLASGSKTAGASVVAEDVCAYWEYRHWSCKVDGDDAEVHLRRKLVVQDARGDSYAHDVFADAPFRELKEVRITVSDDQGNMVRELSRDDLDKHCGFGAQYQVYSDICFYEYRPGVPQYPYSVEYEVEQKLKSLFFLDGTQVSTSIPVVAAVCSLRFEPETPIRFRTYGLGEVTPVDTTMDERILVWEFNSLNGIDSDTLDTFRASKAGQLAVMVDEFEFADAELKEGTWSGLGEWYAAVVADRCDEEIEPEELSETALTSRDRLRLIYDMTRDENRYVSVTIGESGWRPRKASDVVKTRYGDCKDLTTLLVSRLRSVGVEAHPCLILTRGDGYVDPGFPSAGFNHAIALAVIGNDTTWMDPTCSTCPLGELPWYDQYTHALIACDSVSKLVPTPEFPASDNLYLRKSILSVDKDLQLSLTAEIELTGQRAVWYRSSLQDMDHNEIKQSAIDMLSGGAVKWEVSQASFSNVEDLYSPLQLGIEARCERPARVIGNTAYIEACPFGLDPGLSDGDLSDRTGPIRLRSPWAELDSIEVRLDSALRYDSISLPAPIVDSCDFACSKLSSEMASRRVELHSEVSFFDQQIESSGFDRLKEFERALSSSNRGLIKIYLKD
jgi:hypothetical protein